MVARIETLRRRLTWEQPGSNTLAELVMELEEIKVGLAEADYQHRLKAITALRDYDAEVAVPLLLQTRHDREFLVRSFVAMGLGQKQNADSFGGLLEMLKFDRDTNVKAEAANSLSLYGSIAVPHLVFAFYRNTNWLVRCSVLGALVEMNCPHELLDVCILALIDDDPIVREGGIEALGTLAYSPEQDAALAELLKRVDAESWRIRMRVARALKSFDQPSAQEALLRLRQDADHRVVGAVLERTVAE